MLFRDDVNNCMYRILLMIIGFVSIISTFACAPVYTTITPDKLTLTPPTVKKLPMAVAVVLENEDAVLTSMYLNGIPEYYANFPTGKIMKKAVLNSFPVLFKDVEIVKGTPYPENIGAVIIPTVKTVQVTREEVALGFGEKYTIALSLAWVVNNDKGTTIWEKTVSSSKTSRSEISPMPDRIGMIKEAFSGAFEDAFRESVSDIGLASEIRDMAAAESVRTRNEAKVDERNAYELARNENTYSAYETFLKRYPVSTSRRETLSTMSGLIEKKNNSCEAYLKFVTAWEDGLDFVPVQYRLLLSGPESMRIQDIITLRKNNIEDSLLAAKIRAGKGKYKDFSFDEIDTLKKMGISTAVIEAMLDSTARAKNDEEELQKQKAMKDILTEIQRGQARLEELKTEQASPAPAFAAAGQNAGPSVSDTLENCASQIAALEACKHLPGLAAMICRSTAKSQFPCE